MSCLISRSLFYIISLSYNYSIRVSFSGHATICCYFQFQTILPNLLTWKLIFLTNFVFNFPNFVKSSLTASSFTSLYLKTRKVYGVINARLLANHVADFTPIIYHKSTTDIHKSFNKTAKIIRYNRQLISYTLDAMMMSDYAFEINPKYYSFNRMLFLTQVLPFAL